MIHDIQPKMGAIPGTASLRKDLIDSTLVYLEALARDAAGNPGLMRELASSYMELAVIQGAPSHTNLGDTASAARTLARARALGDQLLLADGDNPASLEIAILCQRHSASMWSDMAGEQKAQEHAERALLLSEKLVGMKPDDTHARKVLADSLLVAANTTRSLTRYQRALDAYQSLLAVSSDPDLLRNTALAHKYLSGWYSNTDEPEKRDYHKALEHALQAAGLDEKLLAANPRHPQEQLDFAIDLSMVASSYELLGDLRNALLHMRRSVGIREGVVQANPDDIRSKDRLAWALKEQANYRRRLGDRTRAWADFRRAISIYEDLYARKAINHQMVSGYAYACFAAGDLLKQAGKSADACTHYLKSVHLYAERERMGPLPADDVRDMKAARAAAAACAAR